MSISSRIINTLAKSKTAVQTARVANAGITATGIVSGVEQTHEGIKELQQNPKSIRGYVDTGVGVVSTLLGAHGAASESKALTKTEQTVSKDLQAGTKAEQAAVKTDQAAGKELDAGAKTDQATANATKEAGKDATKVEQTANKAEQKARTADEKPTSETVPDDETSGSPEIKAKKTPDFEAKLGPKETPALTDADKKILDKDLAEREQARTERDAAHARGDTVAEGKAMAKVNQASEHLGEHGADVAIKAKMPGVDVEHAYSGHGKYDLDKVYKNGETYVVVEAKGGSAELGTRKLENGQRAQQGTRQYLEATIDSMSKSTKPETRKIAGELRKALKDGERYVNPTFRSHPAVVRLPTHERIFVSRQGEVA